MHSIKTKKDIRKLTWLLIKLKEIECYDLFSSIRNKIELNQVPFSKLIPPIGDMLNEQLSSHLLGIGYYNSKYDLYEDKPLNDIQLCLTGKIDHAESVIDALKREVMEEIGIEIGERIFCASDVSHERKTYHRFAMHSSNAIVMTNQVLIKTSARHNYKPKVCLIVHGSKEDLRILINQLPIRQHNDERIRYYCIVPLELVKYVQQIIYELNANSHPNSKFDPFVLFQ